MVFTGKPLQWLTTALGQMEYIASSERWLEIDEKFAEKTSSNLHEALSVELAET